MTLACLEPMFVNISSVFKGKHRSFRIGNSRKTLSKFNLCSQAPSLFVAAAFVVVVSDFGPHNFQFNGWTVAVDSCSSTPANLVICFLLVLRKKSTCWCHCHFFGTFFTFFSKSKDDCKIFCIFSIFCPFFIPCMKKVGGGGGRGEVSRRVWQRNNFNDDGNKKWKSV